MGPITLIETALAAGAGKGLSDTAGQVVKDAYNGLKALVLRRVKDQPSGEMVVVEYAKDPQTWQGPLAKTLTSSGADTDTELLKAAQHLMALLDADGTRAGTYTLNITATGDRSVAAHTIYGGVNTGDTHTT